MTDPAQRVAFNFIGRVFNYLRHFTPTSANFSVRLEPMIEMRDRLRVGGVYPCNGPWDGRRGLRCDTHVRMYPFGRSLGDSVTSEIFQLLARIVDHGAACAFFHIRFQGVYTVLFFQSVQLLCSYRRPNYKFHLGCMILLFILSTIHIALAYTWASMSDRAQTGIYQVFSLDNPLPVLYDPDDPAIVRRLGLLIKIRYSLSKDGEIDHPIEVGLQTASSFIDATSYGAVSGNQSLCLLSPTFAQSSGVYLGYFHSPGTLNSRPRQCAWAQYSAPMFSLHH
ncbi:hypothetical protein GGX14DRAFT_392266 [Mycena pura]|uniref:Uncharacterized protein n=1 Tax=Mycena pura TaxID=153505 RepID=A0AAD6VLA9_9AGAR|nr:hypothetical protein GGX14DRAFT_392266 [Mycena pura]